MMIGVLNYFPSLLIFQRREARETKVRNVLRAFVACDTTHL